MKRLLLVVLVVVLVAIGYILFNTLTFSSRQIKAEPVPHVEVPESSIRNFSRALSIPTVSHEDPAEFDSAAFYAFRSFVKEAYPLTDSLLEVTYINEFSIMVNWQGSDPSLKPFIMLGHIDVVPVDREDVAKWSVPPFSGEIKDGKIWGRGAIDDKISVIGNLEAVEMLLQEGFQPNRSLYLCFGHDEEIGGYNGAVAIVEHLQNLNVEAEFVLDEGFAITQGMVPGMEKDVALIGTAEKGFLSLELSYSSVPDELVNCRHLFCTPFS